MVETAHRHGRRSGDVGGALSPRVRDSMSRPRVHLRVLTPDDAGWLAAIDRDASTDFAHPLGWTADELAAELEAGDWASDDQWGWCIVADGLAAGFALVTGASSGDASMVMRIAEEFRGMGLGREVLRQLADHHFASSPDLVRLVGRAHEHNIPMQRAFTAAGFLMEGRFRDAFEHADGTRASEWGYALTRGDFDDGQHRIDDRGFDLHGLAFTVEEVQAEDPHLHPGVHYAFLQERRRVLARYADGQQTVEGELAGLLHDDLLRYHYIHEHEANPGYATHTGQGTARLQRRKDGRLELVSEWQGDDGRRGKTVLVEVRHDTA